MNIRKKERFSARQLTIIENNEVWSILNKQFGIPFENWKDRFGFVENKKGRLWLASNTALEFVKNENIDPAKSLTSAIGNRIRANEGNFTGIRLTVDGVLIFGKNNLKKNLLELNADEEGQWLAGENIIDNNINNGVYIVISSKNKEPLGCTIAKNGKLLNFHPKWRRFPRK